MRVLYVLCEHRGGLTPEILASYEENRARLASLVPGVAVDSVPYEDVAAFDADAVVLSGSWAPWADHDQAALERFIGLLAAHRGPTLGICAGLQLLTRAAGGKVGHAARLTEGTEEVEVLDDTCLLAGAGSRFAVVEHHSDEVTRLPAGMRVIGRSSSCAAEAVAANDRPWWGTQFHPELWDDERPAGRGILLRFLSLADVPARPAVEGDAVTVADAAARLSATMAGEESA